MILKIKSRLPIKNYQNCKIIPIMKIPPIIILEYTASLNILFYYIQTELVSIWKYVDIKLQTIRLKNYTFQNQITVFQVPKSLLEFLTNNIKFCSLNKTWVNVFEVNFLL